MKIMLTSFGIGRTSEASVHRSIPTFYRMPPVSFHLAGSAFMPDYELLVLCDQIVMDESSFRQLVDRPFPAYLGVAETFRALNAEGRIELVDFLSVLRANSDLLDKMLDHDMSILDQWVAPLRESLTTWRRFVERSLQFWRDMQRENREALPDLKVGHADFAGHTSLVDDIGEWVHTAGNKLQVASSRVEAALRSAEKRKRKEYRSALQEVIQAYLAHVNANLVLASELAIPFHDWLDFMPFYSTKFLSVGKREDETQQRRKQVEHLFTVAFPELAIQDTRTLLKVLNDTRVQDLRKLISEAVLGKVQFDEHFAKSVLAEVLRGERRVARFRNILGYVTLPIHFIPWAGVPAQKLVEEAAGAVVAKKMKREHRWFYMLSDVADSHVTTTGEAEKKPSAVNRFC
jgi:hypothetical protein